MQISELTIRIIVLILPGVISAVIVEKLTVHKTWNTFRFIIYSTLLGFIAYLIYQMICPTYLLFWKAIINSNIRFPWKEVLYACLVAIPLGFIISAIIQYKIINRIASLIRVSYKYGDDDVFYHFLSSKEITWLWIRDKDSDTTYEGRLEFFNETNTLREITLRDVKVYRSSTSALIREIPYIYLTFPQDRFIIELPKIVPPMSIWHQLKHWRRRTTK